jgi:hypothetical protein
VGAVLGAFVSVLLLSACSNSDPRDVATTLIRGELADQIGMGDLTDATCDTPAAEEKGQTFECSALTPEGSTITFLAEFVEDDEIFVRTSNIITAGEMPLVESEAAEILSPEVGVEIDPADVACPEVTSVLDEGNTLDCVITDAETGERYGLTVTFSDFDAENGFASRNYVIGDLITE